MGFKKKNEAPSEAQLADGAVATEAVAGTPGGKKIMLTDPTTGEQVARTEVIRALWNGGAGTEATAGAKSIRGAIKNILKTKYNHDVPYQIVFAATKEPKAKAPAAPAAEGSTEAAAT